MRRRWLAAGLWISATAAATVVSFAIVAGVSGRVVTADVSAPPTVTGHGTSDATTDATTSTSASATAPVTPTSASSPPRSASPASPPTTKPPASTTPTTASQAAPPSTVRETYTVEGGILTVACTGPSIALESATPADGYQLRVDRTGPDRVEVRFESDGGGSRVEVTCVGGRPSAQIEHEGGSGGPGGGDDGSGTD